MSKSRVSSLAVLAFVLGVAGQAVAAPMHPSERRYPGNFSAYVQSSFELLADSDNNSLVYFIPKIGGVAILAPQSSDPAPQFAITAYMPTDGIFTGKVLTAMGGTLSPTADLGALQALQNEAQTQGLVIAPAPVKSATTIFSIFGQQNLVGRVDAACIAKEVIIIMDGQTFINKVPECKVKNEFGDMVLTDTMYQFSSVRAPPNGTANQNISFQATVLPAKATQLRNKMNTGAAWNDILYSTIQWEVGTQSLTRQARVTVNWQSVFEQASAFAAFHANACIDVEISAFFQRVATCQGGPTPCGVLVEYRQTNGTWSTQAPNNASFISAVNALEQTLRNELFTQIRAVNGPVSTEARAVFTLRANYEKIITNRNEVIYFTYNEGPKAFGANTTLNLDCMLGGYEAGVVFWDMLQPRCRARVGQP